MMASTGGGCRDLRNVVDMLALSWLDTCMTNPEALSTHHIDIAHLEAGMDLFHGRLGAVRVTSLHRHDNGDVQLFTKMGRDIFPRGAKVCIVESA